MQNKHIFLLKVQKLKLIKTTWLSFLFKYCVEEIEKVEMILLAG